MGRQSAPPAPSRRRRPPPPCADDGPFAISNRNRRQATTVPMLIALIATLIVGLASLAGPAAAKTLSFLSPPAGCPAAPSTDDSMQENPHTPTLMMAQVSWSSALIAVTFPLMDRRSATAYLGRPGENPAVKCVFTVLVKGPPNCVAQAVIQGTFPSLLDCGFVEQRGSNGTRFEGTIAAEWVDRVDVGTGVMDKRLRSTTWTVEVDKPDNVVIEPPAQAGPPPPVAATPVSMPMNNPSTQGTSSAQSAVSPSPLPPPPQVPTSTVGIIAGSLFAVAVIVALVTFFVTRRHRSNLNPWQSTKDRFDGDATGFVWKGGYQPMESQGGFGVVMKDMDSVDLEREGGEEEAVQPRESEDGGLQQAPTMQVPTAPPPAYRAGQYSPPAAVAKPMVAAMAVSPVPAVSPAPAPALSISPAPAAVALSISPAPSVSPPPAPAMSPVPSVTSVSPQPYYQAEQDLVASAPVPRSFPLPGSSGYASLPTQPTTTPSPPPALSAGAIPPMPAAAAPYSAATASATWTASSLPPKVPLPSKVTANSMARSFASTQSAPVTKNKTPSPALSPAAQLDSLRPPPGQWTRPFSSHSVASNSSDGSFASANSGHSSGYPQQYSLPRSFYDQASATASSFASASTESSLAPPKTNLAIMRNGGQSISASATTSLPRSYQPPVTTQPELLPESTNQYQEAYSSWLSQAASTEFSADNLPVSPGYSGGISETREKLLDFKPGWMVPGVSVRTIFEEEEEGGI